MIALLLLHIRPVVKVPKMTIVCLLLLLLMGWRLAVLSLNNSGSPSYNMPYQVKMYVSGMNRAQQGYYQEWGKLSPSLERLGLSIKSDERFTYSVRATPDAAFQYGTTRPDCYACDLHLFSLLPPFIDAGPCLQPTRCRPSAYAGVVAVQRLAAKVVIKAVLCGARAPGYVQLNPTYRNGVVDCGADAKPIFVTRTVVGEMSETVSCEVNTPGTVQRNLIDRRNGVVDCSAEAKEL